MAVVGPFVYLITMRLVDGASITPLGTLLTDSLTNSSVFNWVIFWVIAQIGYVGQFLTNIGILLYIDESLKN